MLELRNLWKKAQVRRKNPWMIAGANAIFPRGRRIAFMSTDPADNKTMLRLLAGLVQPDKGAIKRTGLVSWPMNEFTFLDFKASLRQNSNFLGMLYGLDPKEVAEIALDISGVKVRDSKPLGNLVGPERIQIALGFALAIPFDWYFINEGLPKLPPHIADRIEHAVADRLSRASVVWATTKPAFYTDYCDGGIVLDRGHLEFYDDVKQACAVYTTATRLIAGKK